MIYTVDDGKALINLARHSIKSVLDNNYNPEMGIKLVKNYKNKQGVFVTLHINGELRGCVGFIQPIYTLYEGTIKASKLAAFDDPRFPPLTREEYNDIQIELSILTPPEEITVNYPEDYLKKIKVCRDGLIIDNGFLNGCLLPQVPGEWSWNELEFLEHTCMKAGLHKDTWKEDSCKIMKFTAQVFSEEDNKVIEKRLI